MQESIKIFSKNYPGIALRAIPGHFATASSHINYYIDMTIMKARQSEASAVADAISDQYMMSTIVDTIVCMDGCEVIGAYLAEKLTKSGILSMNAHKAIYVTTPEFSSSGQFIIRDNAQFMIRDKHVLLLLASATTGMTVTRSVDMIKYYGGKVTSIFAIFSAANKVYDLPINALFTTADIPDYKTFSPESCLLCKTGKKIDAIVNGYGYACLK